MLNEKQIKYGQMVPRAIHSAQDMSKFVAGKVAIETLEAGQAVVKVEAGVPAATAKIAGFLYLPYELPAEAKQKEQYTVQAAQLIVKLRKSNLHPGLLIKVGGVVKAIETNFAVGPNDNTEVAVDLATGRLKFHADHAGQVAEVVYTHELSVKEAKMMYGEGFLGNHGQVADLMMCSVIKGMIEIMTDQYDASADWAAGGEVTVGADGKLTIGGAGPKLPQAQILAIPDLSGTAQGAFLKVSCLIG